MVNRKSENLNFSSFDCRAFDSKLNVLVSGHARRPCWDRFSEFGVWGLGIQGFRV